MSEKGERAEAVAQWYLRLNEFMSISGYVIHIDQAEPHTNRNGNQVIQRTEADIVAVRFPFITEVIAGRVMEDDSWITQSSSNVKHKKVLFVLAEVKSSECRLNGPWTNKTSRNMQRLIRRMGFSHSLNEIDNIAESIYHLGRWEGENVILQCVCFGSQKSTQICNSHPEVVQITWADVGHFLEHRHVLFPEKIPGGGIQKQWPYFGKKFANWFYKKQRGLSVCPQNDPGEFVAKFIQNN